MPHSLPINPALVLMYSECKHAILTGFLKTRVRLGLGGNRQLPSKLARFSTIPVGARFEISTYLVYVIGSLRQWNGPLRMINPVVYKTGAVDVFSGHSQEQNGVFSLFGIKTQNLLKTDKEINLYTKRYI